MKYLFLGAHADDIELCCGGTIAKLIEQGHSVKCHSFSYLGQVQLAKENERAMTSLLPSTFSAGNYPTRFFYEHRQELAQEIIELSKDYDTVFTHSKFDAHPDHATIGFECERVLKNYNLVTYCAPWNSLGFECNYFVRLDDFHVKQKVIACAQYSSQQHRPYMNPDYLYSDMRVAGIQCGSVFAERFRAVRLLN